MNDERILTLTCGPEGHHRCRLMTHDGRDLAADLAIVSIKYELRANQRAMLTIEVEGVALDSAALADPHGDIVAAADRAAEAKAKP